MKVSRLDGLVDGIFSIVMTLLIIEIRVPEFDKITNNMELWHALTDLTPLCLSYILSFSLLFTYWRAHSYVISNAKIFNTKLTNNNALFLFFIGLVPFTTHLLGRYGYTQLAILLYGLNIICIGFALFRLNKYIQHSNHHDDMQLTAKSIRHANIRLLVPVFCSILAIGICFINTTLSLILFTLLIIFNLTQTGADIVDYFMGKEKKK